MKLKLTLLFFVAVLLQLSANAQTTIGATTTYTTDPDFPGDVIINSGVSVTVDGCAFTIAGNLTLNGNIYLRNGGQLIQTHTGTTSNDGSGFLSVLQEGTVDNFGYNYWCSPVGSVGSGNGNFGVTMIYDPQSGKPATAIHDPNYNGSPSPNLNIEPYWINTFIGASSYSEWHNEGAGITIPAGYGFSMKGTGSSPQQYDFRGKPNDGDITTSIAGAAALDFTLIGNPYPSAVDLQAFFGDEDNYTDLTQAAFYWEQGKNASHKITDYVGGYGVFGPFGLVTETGSLAAPAYVKAVFHNYDGYGNEITCVSSDCFNPGNPDRMFVPVGQGFMVRKEQNPAFPGNNTVIMKNAFRVFKPEGTNSKFSKKTGETVQNKLPQIRFNTTYNNLAIGQMLQLFSNESTEGFDKADIVNPNYYSTQMNLLVGDERCVISTAPFNMNVKIPLIFDNEKDANYKITVNEIINLDQVANVYLHDIVADKYYDIKNNFYEFTLPAGMNWEQYEITFKDNTLGIDAVTAKSFEIFQDNAVKKLLVSNPFQKQLVSCDLYDIAGKLIFSKKQLGTQSSYEFSTAGLSDGVYIVRATSQENKTKAQKIIVRR